MKSKYLKKSLVYVILLDKKWFISSLVINFLIGVIPVSSLYIVKELVNSVTYFLERKELNLSYIVQLLVCQFALTIIGSVLQHMKEYKDQEFEMKLSFDLKKRVLKRAASVPLSFFDKNEFYNHLTRAEGGIKNFLIPLKLCFETMQNLVILLTLVIFLIKIHWTLVFFSLFISIPVYLINKFFGTERYWLMHNITPDGREANYISGLLTSRIGAKEIRSFGIEDHLLKRWSKKFLSNNSASLKLLLKEKKSQIHLDFLTALSFGSAAGIIIYLIKSASIQIGEFVVVTQSIQNTQRSIDIIAVNIAKINESTLYLKDVYTFLGDEEKEHNLTQAPLQKTASFNLLEFNNVNFYYPESSNAVLKDLSLTINKGEIIAIVGENGSGKSTLIKCLTGLYKPNSGKIKINGTDICLIDPKAYKELFTVIYQDFIKYEFTVEENITISNIHDTENKDKVNEASYKSGAADLIEKLPKGYSTILGKFLGNGQDLSGGQWQRIAIARALFRDKEILVLDEPSAALDPLGEKELFENLYGLSKNKTTIFVTHRMSSVKIADRILVMEGGEIVEAGNHEELLSLNGKYKEMFQTQTQLYNEDIPKVSI